MSYNSPISTFVFFQVTYHGNLKAEKNEQGQARIFQYI